MDIRTARPQSRPELVSFGGCRSFLTLLGLVGLTISGCSAPKDKTVDPPQPEITPSVQVGSGAADGFSLIAAQFDQLPGWSGSDPSAALSAFQESCRRIERTSEQAPMSTRAAYNAGTVDDWRAACTAARVSDSSTPQQRRALFETHFRPFKVLAPSDTSSKLTGYFEPMLKVSAVKTLEFDTPIASKPDDIITVDVSEFHGASGEGRIVGKLEGSRLKPYDTRSEISGQPQSAIAWGNAADVFYLQIQGSGRLQFPDGREFRAAYAAHNGQPFVSIAKHLINEGEIEPHQAGIDGVKSWMAKAGHDAAQAAMNVNPRYVWFAAEEIADPEKGPRGAEGVALTPMGSMAVDPSYHAYGVPIFLDTLVPQKPGDWKGEPFQSLVIAQDTGGAIRGAARGDLFFGWGDVAGGRAGSMNHPVDMWVLLPTQLVSQADWAG